MFNTQDTIAAIITPPGEGAIGIVRISGPNAIAVANRFYKEKDLYLQSPNTIHFGQFREQDGSILDEILISVFKQPRSYTGEDVIEISFHGSDYILNKALMLILNQNVRMAENGEFTFRAFINGKLDLSQAEAVADLIASDSEKSHQIAIQQMRGGFSKKLNQLRQQLIDFAALVELELDFAEEDIEFANRQELNILVSQLIQEITILKDSFQAGNVLKTGVPVAIVGKPNAGKSTLLNALLKEERAIVSDIEGTTRDSIEETILLAGVKFRFIDTAGLRNTKDIIEQQGVERAKNMMQKAALIILLYDLATTTEDEIETLKQQLPKDKKLLIVANKSDLLPNQHLDSSKYINISAKEGVIDELYQALEKYAQELDNNGDLKITNMRHYEALTEAQKALELVIEGLEIQRSGDMLAFDIREAINYIGKITGTIDIDKDILGTIFGRFCIGK